MKFRVFIVIVALLAIGLSSAYAGNERRIGTAGAQELRIPVGSRGTAMGGSIISDVYGVESMFWNPAGMANLIGTEAMFSHQPYIADIDINYIGIATSIEDFGTIGASVKVVSIGDINETTTDGPNDGETGRVFSPTFSVLTVGYARELTARVSFGFTGSFINERILNTSASGISFDVGFIYRPGWQGVSLGLMIKNYGPSMRFKGDDLYYFDPNTGQQVAGQSESFDLPSSFNIGMSWDFLDMGANLAKVTGNFMSNNYSQDNFQGGFEYTYDGKYSLRAGYNYSDQTDWQYGFAMGAGVVVNVGGADVTFEYTWSEVDNSAFDANQYFTGKVNF